MANVKLREVSKIYGENVKAVDSVTLEIPDQEFVVLVGPSGCGKSTTLRMVAGLEEISSGEVYIGDRLVNEVPPKDRDIAMVFQNYALYPHMSVYENMAFGLKLRKFSKSEIKQRVDDAARILGLGNLLERKPKALSGGQRQRVAVGRAIVRKPKVFLFDEPLSNLDAKLRVQMRAEISKLHNRLETTMIYVTHDQVEAMTMGDRIVVMKDGIVQQVDTPLNLYHHPANQFVAGFIGSPAMNFLQGQIAANGAVKFGGNQFEFPIPGKYASPLQALAGQELTFGIRPEDIQVAQETVESGESRITAIIEVIEPLGSEIYLHLSVGGTTIIARVSAQIDFAVGSRIPIAFDMHKAHFFQSGTGEKIKLEQ